MEYAYSYQAKNRRGTTDSGVIHAKSRAAAMGKLKKAGFKTLNIKLHIGETVRAQTQKEFNPRELSRFYMTVGRRMQNGKGITDGLEAAIEYIKDPRLRQAVMLMLQFTLDGQPEFQSMMAAGFPRRDCLAIKATSEAGKAASSFLSLGEEIQRIEQMRSAVKSTFRIPKVMAIFMIIFIWAAIVFMAPMTLNFFKQTGLRMNFSPFIEWYFEFVEVFNGGLPRNDSVVIVSSLIYFSSFAAIGFFFKSNAFRALLDKNETLRTLSIKSDHATLWNSYVLLYDAAIQAKEAAAIVGDSAKRADSKRSFYRMAKALDSGVPMEVAVSNADFPPVIVSGIKAADSSGSLVIGISEMAKNLEEDVRILTELMQENVKVLSLLFMGLGLLLVFTLTYYPMMSSVMSNL